MPDNMGFYLWLLLMLFIVGLLGSLTVLIWKSEKRGNFKDVERRPPKPEDVDRSPHAKERTLVDRE